MYNHLTVYTVLQYYVAYRMHVQYVVKKLMAELTNSTTIIRVWQVYLFSSQLGSKGQRCETHSVDNVCEWLWTFTWTATANIKNKVIHVLAIHVYANNTNATILYNNYFFTYSTGTFFKKTNLGNITHSTKWRVFSQTKFGGIMLPRKSWI